MIFSSLKFFEVYHLIRFAKIQRRRFKATPPGLFVILFNLVLLSGLYAQTGFRGTVMEQETGNGLAGATVRIGERGIFTDFEGHFQLALEPGNYLVTISYIGFKTRSVDITIPPSGWAEMDIRLEALIGILETAVISDSRYQKPLGESTVSLELIKKGLIDHLNSTSVDEVLDKVPGLNMIGDQANIRGGSGFSYGAGSRVLLMVNDIPALQADAGYPNWDDLPVENIEQIEVIKGAASAIYGSAALNGLVHVRTAFARTEPLTRASLFYNPVMAPKDKSQQWWSSAPYTAGMSLSHARKAGKWDLVGGLYALNNKSYNQTSRSDYQRVNGSVQYRITDRLVAGTHFNINNREGNSFFYWKDGVHAFYRPDSLTLSQSNSFRYHVDPYVHYFDQRGNKHSFLSRVYVVDNSVSSGQSNSSSLWYGEYRFQKAWTGLKLVTTAGLVYAHNRSESPLLNLLPLKSNQAAAYIQAEKKLGSGTTVSLGWRWEDYRLSRPEVLAGDTLLGGKKRDHKNLFRLGLNTKVGEGTFLRASLGQGFRFPTLTEQFITTSFGSTFISPNPGLKSETGWTAEIGAKQGFRINRLTGFVDGALFWSRYRDMMEFVFTGFVKGFQSQNIGNTDIKGYELSLGAGSTGRHRWSFLGGYTYINPKFVHFTEEDNRRSSADFNILKYRSRHLFKLDVEDAFGDWILGSGILYTSRMEAIDAIFELVISGLKAFREVHKGYTVMDLRIARKWKPFTFNLILKNLLNEEYSSRPALMDAPRNITFKMDYRIEK
ncbi:MAG TPA: TonB-dependent receptor [Saprospiraceae bacterium]|nr:TonB-dependent receptor [Saprospiraceae bacterium]